jgi:hypothetical protein
MKKKDKTPNYKMAIYQAIKEGLINPAPGTVTHIHVYHDDYCEIFKGGVCNCDPDIITENQEKKDM